MSQEEKEKGMMGIVSSLLCQGYEEWDTWNSTVSNYFPITRTDNHLPILLQSYLHLAIAKRNHGIEEKEWEVPKRNQSSDKYILTHDDKIHHSTVQLQF